jgi:hypothetical protein
MRRRHGAAARVAARRALAARLARPELLEPPEAAVLGVEPAADVARRRRRASRLERVKVAVLSLDFEVRPASFHRPA